MTLFLKILFKGLYLFFIRKNQRVFMWLVLKYGNKPRYLQKNINFLKYKIIIPDCLSFVWQFKEIFADENYKFVTDNSAPLIYDCGANIGMSCIYYKEIFPASVIKAFEADPKIAQILIGNLKQNSLSDIEIVSKAVWIHNNGINISSDGADASSIYSDRNVIKVESIRLKELIEKEKQIDMLKIDIEGAETDVLKDCRNSLSNVRNIFIEYHSFTKRPQDLNEILNILSANKFRYFIKQPLDREKPFINKLNKNFPEFDLQLNIFGYKNQNNTL